MLAVKCSTFRKIDIMRPRGANRPVCCFYPQAAKNLHILIKCKLRKMNSQLLLAFGSLFYGEVSQVDVAFGFLCLEGNRENLSLEKDYSSKF